MYQGQATYCTATIFYKSTYSKTAIVNGPCAFLDYNEANCKVEDAVVGKGKERLMQVKGKDIINIVPPVPDPVERERIWNTVVQTKEVVRTQCFYHPTSSALVDYWSVNDENNKFQDRVDLIKHVSIGTGQVYGQNEQS